MVDRNYRVEACFKYYSKEPAEDELEEKILDLLKKNGICIYSGPVVFRTTTY